MSAITIVLVLLAVLAVAVVSMTVKIVPQARAGIVERFGKYRTTLSAGLNIVVPFVDKVRYMIDLREQVVSFPPQPVITEDNLTVSIDTVIYFQVTDAGLGDLRDRRLHPGHRAAHHDDAAQHHRWHDARARAHQPRPDQLRPARRARRRHRQVGHPRQPRRAQGHRPAAVDHRRDGEADAGRARQARRHPHRRGRAAVGDPHRRGRQAGADPDRRGRRSRRRSSPPRATVRPPSSAPRARGRPSSRCSRPSTTATPTRSCCRTSTCRCSRRSPRARTSRTWIIPAEVTKALGTLGGTFGKIPADGGGSKKRVDLDEPVVADATEDADTQAAVEQALKAAKDAEGPGGGFKGPGQVTPTSPVRRAAAAEEPPQA